MAKRYIDADNIPYYLDTSEEAPMEGRKITFKSDIDRMPTADVEEVKHAYWEEHVEKGNCFEHTYYICTNCGVGALDEEYEIRCHHCGAKMDGGKGE